MLQRRLWVVFALVLTAALPATAPAPSETPSDSSPPPKATYNVADYVDKHSCHHFDAERACIGSDLLYGHILNGMEEMEPDSNWGEHLQELASKDIRMRVVKHIRKQLILRCCELVGCSEEKRNSEGINCLWSFQNFQIESLKVADLNFVLDETDREFLKNSSISRELTLGTSIFLLGNSTWSGSLHGKKGQLTLRHMIGYTVDHGQFLHLQYFAFSFLPQDTIFDTSSSTPEKQAFDVDEYAEVHETSETQSGPKTTTTLRILDYNVWNSNPPQWLFRSRVARWNRYIQRMKYLTRQIREADPDILLLQELRMDQTLDEKTMRYSQIDHLTTMMPGYQYVFQPAHYFTHAAASLQRDEEGVGVFSKYPIVDTEYLLLSQNLSDLEDEHRRVVLHVVISIPAESYQFRGACTTGHVYNSSHCAKLLDVYTAHFPLSKAARQRHSKEVLTYIKQSRKGDIQIFGGDLNAEPSEDEIEVLLHKEVEHEYPNNIMLDTWLCHHPEPATGDSASDDERENALTFASDNATKRIDYVFVSAASSLPMEDICPNYPFPVKLPSGSPNSMKLKHVHPMFLIGQHHLPGTGDPENSDGMIDKNSPLYASDHRGLVVDLTMETHS